MKKFVLIAALALMPLAACAPVTNPQNAAQQTTLDEKVGITAEVSYTTASKLGTALARAGLIDKTKFKAADAKAYTALGAVRKAYDAGNATDYATAVVTLNAAVAEIRALVK